MSYLKVAHLKWKDLRFVSCFEVVHVGENDAYVIDCFIECGYHTLLNQLVKKWSDQAPLRFMYDGDICYYQKCSSMSHT